MRPTPLPPVRLSLSLALALGAVVGCGEDSDASGALPDAAGGAGGTTPAPDGTPGDTGTLSDGAPPDAAPTPDVPGTVPPDAALPDAALPDAAAPGLPLDHPVPPECQGDLAPGQKALFYEGFATGTEGIAFGPDGLYVSAPRENAIWRFDADGHGAVFAEVPHPIGLAFLSDGRLAVADLGESNSVGVPDGAVHLVERDGRVSVLATGIDSPNFLAALPDDSLLVADDFDTRVWHVRLDGQVSLALEAVPSPNGMAFTVARDRLLIASTFTPEGEISAYGLLPSGLPDETTAAVLFRNGAGQTQDGVAMDQYDQLYVAHNLPGKIVRYRITGDQAPEGGATPVEVIRGLHTPASLAFGRGEGFDPCSIYVTELLGPEIWRVAVGAAGAPLP